MWTLRNVQIVFVVVILIALVAPSSADTRALVNTHASKGNNFSIEFLSRSDINVLYVLMKSQNVCCPRNRDHVACVWNVSIITPRRIHVRNSYSAVARVMITPLASRKPVKRPAKVFPWPRNN